MKTTAFEVHMPKTLDDALETAKHLHRADTILTGDREVRI